MREVKRTISLVAVLAFLLLSMAPAAAFAAPGDADDGVIPIETNIEGNGTLEISGLRGIIGSSPNPQILSTLLVPAVINIEVATAPDEDVASLTAALVMADGSTQTLNARQDENYSQYYYFDIPACMMESLTIDAVFDTDPDLPGCELQISGPESVTPGETVTLELTADGGKISGYLLGSGLDLINPNGYPTYFLYIDEGETEEVQAVVTALDGAVSVKTSECKVEYDYGVTTYGRRFLLPETTWSAPISTDIPVVPIETNITGNGILEISGTEGIVNSSPEPQIIGALSEPTTINVQAISEVEYEAASLTATLVTSDGATQNLEAQGGSAGVYRFDLPACEIESLAINAAFDKDPSLPPCEISISGPEIVTPGETISLQISVTSGDVSGTMLMPELSILDTDTKDFEVSAGRPYEFGARITPLSGTATVRATGCMAEFPDVNGDSGQLYIVPDVEWTAPIVRIPAASVITENNNASYYIQIELNPDYDPESGTGDNAVPNILTGIPIEPYYDTDDTTVAGIANWITVPEGASIEVMQADGSPADPSAQLATGQVINVTDADGSLMAQAAIVIDGDVLGTGVLSIAQLVRCAKAINRTEPLVGVYRQAAKIYGRTGNVNISDLQYLAYRIQLSGE